MTWADSVPNLLIGLREGLEAGLVVTILLAAVRKTAATRAERAPTGEHGPTGVHGPTGEHGSSGKPGDQTISTAPIWLGVLAAVTLSGAFAAVLTFSLSVLSSAGQEAVGGLLSVLAVCLVTAMIFWMRRTAATLSAHLRGEVARAAAIGTGALTLTAFLSVGREGLETTLFLWTAAKASGQTVGPLVGAAIGIAAAVVLCWLLYRRAVHLNVGVFFNRTAIALIVIAAGVLAYGLGDLQDANWLPGHSWIAFDLTANIDPSSWWASIITGITELSPKMTVLQITAWVAYLVVVIPAFVHAGRPAAKPAQQPVTSPAAPSTPVLAAAATSGAAATSAAPATSASAGDVPALAPASASSVSSSASDATPVATNGASPNGAPPSETPVGASAPAAPSAPRDAPRELPWWERVAASRPWLVAGVLVAVPALAAGLTIVALPAPTASASTVTVTKTGCAPEWTTASAGSQTITVTNNSGLAGEVDLDNAAGAVIGEIETIGPATSAPLTATLGSGTYTIKCLMGSQAATSSQPVTVSDTSGNSGSGPVAVRPVTLGDLTGPNQLYQSYAAVQLTALSKSVAAIESDLRANNIAATKTEWLAAQLQWERVGASYDSFGDLGLAVDGLPDGLVNGVNDQGFTGLKRLEYGLWNGQPAKELLPVAETLAKNVTTVQKDLNSDDLAGDPTQLPIRAHEIIEDALRDHLSGIDNQGGDAAYPMTYADTQVDRVVLGYLSVLIDQRVPGLVATADSELSALDSALLATQTASGQWQPLSAVTLSQREHVDATIGTLLETLATVPDLLEVPPAHGVPPTH